MLLHRMVVGSEVNHDAQVYIARGSNGRSSNNRNVTYRHNRKPGGVEIVKSLHYAHHNRRHQSLTVDTLDF
jgi:hypothetical protein